MGFPRSLYVVLAISMATMVVGHQIDGQSQQLHQDRLEIRLGLERMLRLNGALTEAVAGAVSAKSSLRLASYPSLKAELDATMRATLELTRDKPLAGDMAALHQDQQALRELEGAVVQHVQSGDWRLARQVLQDGDYMQALKLYEISSESVVGALSIALSQEAARQQRWRWLTDGARLGALVLLVWAGWWHGRRLQRQLQEQTRLRTELLAAREALEEKVRDRTAELETANRQLQALSLTDDLTGLANRRRFDVYWADEWQRSARSGQSLAVIMLDVDQFKAYNDHYGHPQGDECLRRIGEVLRATVRRAGELAARYGGEEFVVVLPGASIDVARERAESLRAAVQAEGMPHARSTHAPVVTISLGVAVGQPGAEDTRDHLLKSADEALYRAKAAGRNRVEMAEVA